MHRSEALTEKEVSSKSGGRHGRHGSRARFREGEGAANAPLPGDVIKLLVAFYPSPSSAPTRTVNKSYIRRRRKKKKKERNYVSHDSPSIK